MICHLYTNIQFLCVHNQWFFINPSLTRWHNDFPVTAIAMLVSIEYLPCTSQCCSTQVVQLLICVSFFSSYWWSMEGKVHIFDIAMFWSLLINVPFPPFMALFDINSVHLRIGSNYAGAMAVWNGVYDVGHTGESTQNWQVYLMVAR